MDQPPYEQLKGTGIPESLTYPELSAETSQSYHICSVHPATTPTPTPQATFCVEN